MVLKQEKKDVVQFCKHLEILLLAKIADKKIFFAFLWLQIHVRMILAFCTKSRLLNRHSGNSVLAVAEILPERFLKAWDWPQEVLWTPWNSAYTIIYIVNEYELVFFWWGKTTIRYSEMFDLPHGGWGGEQHCFISYFQTFLDYTAQEEIYIFLKCHDSAHTHKLNWNQVFRRLSYAIPDALISIPFSF